MDPAALQTLGDKDLYDFLVNCPKDFRENERIRKFQLKNGDYIHCVLWNFHFYITGTDIVKILIWRFQNAGRPIGAIKKFEEGVFSDLRNLKPGVDATLEGPRTEFLEFLYKNGCIRTQKKQKVFYWYSVPHDELFCDALERDLRRDTSIYTYNRYVQDPQRMHIPERAGSPMGASNTQSLFATMSSRKPMGGELSGNDVFSIKDALFGKNEQAGGAPVDLFNTKGMPGYQDPRDFRMGGGARPGSGCMFGTLKGTESGRAMPPFKVPSRQMHNMPDEPSPEQKVQRSKSAIDRKLNFDDFDLGQFDFLKERCKEHFSRSSENCEQKLFEEHSKDDKINGIDRMGEIRFVGSKDRK